MVKEKTSETEKKIREISDVIDKLNSLLDAGWFFSDGVVNELAAGAEIPKKKKEKEEFLKKKAVERFPELVKQINELDVALQGVGLYIEDAMATLEERQDQLSEIEDMQEEIERKKSELDF